MQKKIAIDTAINSLSKLTKVTDENGDYFPLRICYSNDIFKEDTITVNICLCPVLFDRYVIHEEYDQDTSRNNIQVFSKANIEKYLNSVETILYVGIVINSCKIDELYSQKSATVMALKVFLGLNKSTNVDGDYISMQLSFSHDTRAHIFHCPMIDDYFVIHEECDLDSSKNITKVLSKNQTEKYIQDLSAILHVGSHENDRFEDSVDYMCRGDA